MQCPRCGMLLNEIAKAGVLVDVCDRCHGVWLERGELDKIVARLRELEREWNGDGRWDDRPEREGPWKPGLRFEEGGPRTYVKKRRWTDVFDIFD